MKTMEIKQGSKLRVLETYYIGNIDKLLSKGSIENMFDGNFGMLYTEKEIVKAFMNFLNPNLVEVFNKGDIIHIKYYETENENYTYIEFFNETTCKDSSCTTFRFDLMEQLEGSIENILEDFIMEEDFKYCINCGEDEDFTYIRTTASPFIDKGTKHYICNNCGEELSFMEDLK